jgi:hypothetical protein
MEQVMKFNVSPKLYTILGTYARAFIAAVVAQYLLGNTSVKALFAAGMSAVLQLSYVGLTLETSSQRLNLL